MLTCLVVILIANNVHNCFYDFGRFNNQFFRSIISCSGKFIEVAYIACLVLDFNRKGFWEDEFGGGHLIVWSKIEAGAAFKFRDCTWNGITYMHYDTKNGGSILDELKTLHIVNQHIEPERTIIVVQQIYLKILTGSL